MRNDGRWVARDQVIQIKGEIDALITRHDGAQEIRAGIKNLFVTAGANYLAAFQSTSPGSVMNHISVGTGTTAAALGDTALGAQIGSRATMASRTAAGNVLTEVATFAGFLSGVTSAPLTELGVFNATSGGTMRSRAVFAAITLADSDFVNFSYRTTVGS